MAKRKKKTVSMQEIAMAMARYRDKFGEEFPHFNVQFETIPTIVEEALRTGQPFSVSGNDDILI